jgi:hypothetical protein
MTNSSAVTAMPISEHRYRSPTLGVSPGAVALPSVTPSIIHFVTG